MPRKLDPRLDDLKERVVVFLEITTRVESSPKALALDVTNLPLRERHMVRSTAHRWGHKHGWLTGVHYDPREETLHVRVEGRRDE